MVVLGGVCVLGDIYIVFEIMSVVWKKYHCTVYMIVYVNNSNTFWTNK